MSMKSIALVSLCFFVFLCCNHSERQKMVAEQEFYPLEQTTLVDDVAPFIDSVEIIQLEAKEGAFITLIDKILLTPDKQLIILNSTGIMAFDANGSFRQRIGKIGRAPGEYQKIYDMCLDETGKYLLAVDNNNQVLQYAVDDGRFIKKIVPQLPSDYPPVMGIAPASLNGFFLFGCNPYDESNFEDDFYCLHQFDSTGGHTEHFLLRKDYVLTPTLITQSYKNTYLIRPQTWDNIGYRIQNGQISPAMKIDFKDKTMPCNYVKIQPTIGFDLQKYLFAPYFKLPIYFQETEEHLYFCAAAPKNADNVFFIQNRNKSTGIRWEVEGESNPNLLLGKASDENYFYYVFHDYNEYDEMNIPAKMDPLKKYLIVHKQVKLLGEDSNPMIIKIKFNI